MTRMLSNYFYCILTPSIAAGIFGLGIFILSVLNGFSFFDVFISGAMAYLVGSLIRSCFEWEGKK